MRSGRKMAGLLPNLFLILIFGIVIFGAHGSGVVKTLNLDDGALFAVEVNECRGQVAKAYGASGMNAVRWGKTMAEKAYNNLRDYQMNISSHRNANGNTIYQSFLNALNRYTNNILANLSCHKGQCKPTTSLSYMPYSLFNENAERLGCAIYLENRELQMMCVTDPSTSTKLFRVDKLCGQCPNNCDNGLCSPFPIKTSYTPNGVETASSHPYRRTEARPELSGEPWISYILRPPSLKWQQEQCAALGLQPPRHLSNHFNASRQFNTHMRNRLEILVKGDGNCGFRALAFFVTGSQDNHVVVRNEVCDYMKKHQMPDMSPQQRKKYLQRMRLDGAWMTDVELEASAKCFKIHIYVYETALSPSRWLYFPPYDIGKNQKDEFPTAAIHHYADHFQIIVDIF